MVSKNWFINQSQFITFKGLTTTFKVSTNVSFDTDLLIFVNAIHLLVFS